MENNNHPKFELIVYVYRRPNLRDEDLEFERFIGRGVLDSLFDKMEMRKDVKNLSLSFPEQWLNILEQRALYPRLEYFCPNLTKVTIKTHSVYIIQCTKSENVRIYQDPLIEEVMENTPELVSRKLWNPMGGTNLFNPGGITVVYG